MNARPHDPDPAECLRGVAARRHIGPVGTGARVLLGLAFIVSGAFGHATTTASGLLVAVDLAHFNLNVAALVVGLLVLPALTVAFQWLRSRRVEARLDE